MHILIDGYNFIGRKKGLHGDLEPKREKLIHDLSHYKEIKGFSICVVFDGWKSGWETEHQEKYKGITVIFSRRGERADTVIARIAEKKGNRCIVVTSDRELQRLAQNAGATTMFSGEFEDRLYEAIIQKGLSSPWEKGESDRDEEQKKPGKPKRGNPYRRPKAERRRQGRLKKL